MNICSKCGAAIVEGSQFCMKCGAPVPKPEQEVKSEGEAQSGASSPEIPTAPVCRRCGEALSPGVMFCMKCGAAVTENKTAQELSAPQPVPQPASQSAQQPVPQPAPQPVPQSAQQPAQQPAPQPAPHPVPQPVPQPAPQPVPQFAQQPAQHPVPQHVPQPAPPPYSPVSQPQQAAPPPQAQPVAPQTQPAAQQQTQPATQQSTQAIQPATEKVKKPFYKRTPVIIAAAVLLVVIAAAGFLFGSGVVSFGNPASGTRYFSAHDENLAYIKENELFIANIKSLNAFQATSDLFSGETTRNTSFYDLLINPYQIQITSDGSRLFYPDRTITDGTYNLNTRTISGNGKNPGEPVRLDTDIRGVFRTSEDGRHVFYIKGESRTLYWYDVNKDRTRIASEIDEFIINKNGTLIYYTDSSSNLYFKKRSAAEPEKVDGESELVGASPDFSTVYYIKDSTLYRKKLNESRVKISSGISYMLMIYDSGELYYVKETDDEDRKTVDTAYYYDGANETKLGANMEFDRAFDVGSVNPVLVYSVYAKDGDTSGYRLAVKGLDSEITVSKTFRDPALNPSETKLYYIDDFNETRQTGDLWCAEITDSGKKQASHLYEDVYSYSLTKKGGVIYFCHLNKAETMAELYLDGKMIDIDVSLNQGAVEIGETGSFLYYVDYNVSKGRGSLKICENGKPVLISDDVALFTQQGAKTASYLIVEGTSNLGELYRYDGSKNKKRIDSDVLGVMHVYRTGSGGRYRGYYNR